LYWLHDTWRAFWGPNQDFLYVGLIVTHINGLHFFSGTRLHEYSSVQYSISRHRKVVKESFINLVRCDGRPVWSRTSDCQSGNPGSNPGRRMSVSIKGSCLDLRWSVPIIQVQSCLCVLKLFGKPLPICLFLVAVLQRYFQTLKRDELVTARLVRFPASP
jgi:hypothetical protein